MHSCTISIIHQLYFYHIFFFNDTATTEIYTLSLHDALPISSSGFSGTASFRYTPAVLSPTGGHTRTKWKRPSDRKSTRLNSSHSQISYAVFCLEKKKTIPSSDA